MHLFLSIRLWRAGNRDGAFAALEHALAHARAFDRVCGQKGTNYAAPLLSAVRIDPDEGPEPGWIVRLPEDWPWWCVPGDGQAEAEMKADPRWTAWVSRTREES